MCIVVLYRTLYRLLSRYGSPVARDGANAVRRAPKLTPCPLSRSRSRFPLRPPPLPGIRHRNLQLHQEHGRIADDLFFDNHLDSVERYWNTSAAATERTAVADDGVFEQYGAAAGLESGSSWNLERTAVAGSAAEYMAGWGGSDGVEERPAADYAYGRFAMEEGEGAKGLDYDYGDDDGEAPVDPARRRLVGAKRNVFPGVPWAEVWGPWGKEGERIFDETCYQRMERVTPVRRLCVMLCDVVSCLCLCCRRRRRHRLLSCSLVVFMLNAACVTVVAVNLLLLFVYSFWPALDVH